MKTKQSKARDSKIQAIADRLSYGKATKREAIAHAAEEMTPAIEAAKQEAARDLAGRMLARDAAEWIQTLPSVVIASAARGEVDLNAIARAELALRGLDWSAKWVGFSEAAQIAKMLPARGRNGKAIAVSVPE